MLITCLSCEEQLYNENFSIIGDNVNSLSYLESIDLVDDDYDNFADHFSKSLAKAIVDKDLRKRIKEDAILRVDGDYDILWKDFKNKMPNGNNEKIITKVAKNYDKDGANLSEKEAQIMQKSEKYKRFQISVPVNCEDWNTDATTPLVAYIPSNFDESWESIMAYDSKGKKHILSLKEIPDFPVIVVGLNERSDINGDILTSYKKREVNTIIEGPPSPTNLTAASSICTQVNLFWAFSSIDPIVGFNIYRKKYGEFSFSLIATIPSYRRYYYDIDVDQLTTYYYFVRSNDGNEESLPSNQAYANVPSCISPGDPDNLEITYASSSTITLNWDNVANEAGYSIYRASYANGVLGYWSQIGTTGVNSTEFDQSNIISDRRYHYKVYSYNNNETSASSNTVIVYGSNRSVIANERATYCYWKTWDGLRLIESWISGAPEMALKIISVNGTSGDAIQLSGGPHTFEPAKDDYIVLPIKFYWMHDIFNWDITGNLLVVVNWYWYEVDPNDTEMSATAGVTAEFPPKSGVKISASATVKITAGDDQICCQPVHWHDDIPKEYDMGEFVFAIDQN